MVSWLLIDTSALSMPNHAGMKRRSITHQWPFGVQAYLLILSCQITCIEKYLASTARTPISLCHPSISKTACLEHCGISRPVRRKRSGNCDMAVSSLDACHAADKTGLAAAWMPNRRSVGRHECRSELRVQGLGASSLLKALTASFTP